MGEHRDQFQARLKQINRKHKALSAGYSAKLRPDGLLVVKPHRLQSPVSGRSILLFVAAFLLFKSFLMAVHGFDSYDERVQTLAAGSGVEHAGAFLMQADPVSVFFARKIGPVLR
ncbi:hypothetical protein [Leisingera methylohalidivorans]|uniref:Uncharacterized protein n=1 Tax=Leisingera methylohalidivorans DSM 14336 TaxID=999552 RepID=V9VVA0_9RHOB|nr:hypothetical protein [Leisingera methylohalidivorans]AHD01649.1 hypothetical protein METH_13935 [Leisingera methylohalidivorans DSM 14336]